MLRSVRCYLALIAAGILTVILCYYKVGSDSGFEHSTNSQSFGPCFMKTIVGVLIYRQWKRLERGTLQGIQT